MPLPQPFLYDLRRLWLTLRNQRWLCPDASHRAVSRNAAVAHLPSQYSRPSLSRRQGQPPVLTSPNLLTTLLQRLDSNGFAVEK